MKKILFVCLCVIIMVFTYGCTLETENHNTITKKYVSPNGKYIAYCFVRDMGATTAKSHHLSIFQNNKMLGDSSGNIFVSYEPFIFTWRKDGNAVIRYMEGEIFKRKEVYKDIKILYVKQEENGNK